MISEESLSNEQWAMVKSYWSGLSPYNARYRMESPAKTHARPRVTVTAAIDAPNATRDHAFPIIDARSKIVCRVTKTGKKGSLLANVYHMSTSPVRWLRAENVENDGKGVLLISPIDMFAIATGMRGPPRWSGSAAF